MNTDQLKGKWMQVKGDLQQQWGEFIHDDLRQVEGSFNKILGMLQERYGGDCASLVQERYGTSKHELISWAGRWQRRSRLTARKERGAERKASRSTEMDG